jgi:phospholipase/carboxylesterase
MRQFTRRDFLRISAAGAAGTSAFASACSLDTAAPRTFTEQEARIIARPGIPSEPATIGYSALGLTTPRDALMYVPTTYVPANPAPLLVLLHPNGQDASFWETYGIGELLDDLGVVILAPDSRYASWDIIAQGGYASDPTYISFALDYLFKRCAINPSKVAIAGFSDGGMESLGIGLANGDFVTNVMAYSPGALATPWQVGKPKIWISHGQSDPQLSFEFCRDQIAQKLTDASYNVTFTPFLGGHSIPTDILRQSIEWFVA